jgi:hypothetical protein
LHGIPWGVKDLFATKEIPTTWGLERYKIRVIDLLFNWDPHFDIKKLRVGYIKGLFDLIPENYSANQR